MRGSTSTSTASGALPPSSCGSGRSYAKAKSATGSPARLSTWRSHAPTKAKRPSAKHWRWRGNRVLPNRKSSASAICWQIPSATRIGSGSAGPRSARPTASATERKMIPVAPASEPGKFDTDVRKPGLRAIAGDGWKGFALSANSRESARKNRESRAGYPRFEIPALLDQSSR